MEFACEFVYVPPTLNAIKVSALLPRPKPVVRPRTPPPPPPTSTPHPVTPSPRAIEERKVANSSFYENASFRQGTVSGAASSQHTSAKKTALLPPHMRNSPPVKPRSASYSEPWTSEALHHPPQTEPHSNGQSWDDNYSYNIPESSDCSGLYETKPPGRTNTAQSQAPAPTLPPRPVMQPMPEYVMVLPSQPSTTAASAYQPLQNTTKSFVDTGPLQGNPNVVLVSVGKLLSEEGVELIQGEPVSCSNCGSVLESIYANVVEVCYFCKEKESAVPISVPKTSQDVLFSLSPSPDPPRPSEPLLLFCIDTSGSMSITSPVIEGGHTVHRSRLEFVQNAVLHCVERLSEQQPTTRVGLITFNYKVTLHGYEHYQTQYLSSAELIEPDYLKQAAASFFSPPPISKNKEYLRRQVMGLKESGTTALGPAALLTIEMASRHPGSKVIICTDGKANTELGNLEEEDIDARTLLSSTIFYQQLGDYAVSQGVTVSVLSIEGTDCRLDELGRLADRTGGKVVIASPKRLHEEFEEIIQNRTIATHCTVSFLLPKSLRVKGEREASHKGSREVGNVDPEKEITFQFGASDNGAGAALVSGSTVFVQLQLRYSQRNGQKMLRVITAAREVTTDSQAVLSSLSLAIIQLNSSQATAALAVRGRFADGLKEGEQQRRLIERAISHSGRIEDKLMYQDWVKTMESLHDSFHNFTRKKSVTSDSQSSLTDAGAALLYTMKHTNRKSIHIH